jgi:hypothetical protein
MKIAIHYDCNAVDAARIALSAPPYNLPMDYATSSHVFLLGPVSQHALEYIDKVQGNVIFHVRSHLNMLTFQAKKGKEIEPIFIDTIFQDMNDVETCIFLLNHSLSVPILSLISHRVSIDDMESMIEHHRRTNEFHEILKDHEYGYGVISEKDIV